MRQNIHIWQVFVYVKQHNLFPGRKCERRSLGLWLDRNSCLISALSGLHHCHSQQGVHTDSWEICSGVQQDLDECKKLLLYLYRARNKITQLSVLTHAQLRHRLKFIKNHLKTPTCFGLRPSSGSYNVLAKITIIFDHSRKFLCYEWWGGSMSCCLYWVILEERLSLRVLASAVDESSTAQSLKIVEDQSCRSFLDDF